MQVTRTIVVAHSLLCLGILLCTGQPAAAETAVHGTPSHTGPATVTERAATEIGARADIGLTYDRLVDSLRVSEAAMLEMEMTFYGTSAAGRALPLLVLNKDRQFTAKRLRRTGRPLMLVVAASHGDEAAGSLAVERLIQHLRGDGADLLDSANFLLVPALDVDGLATERSEPRHTTLAGLDLDRDWLKVRARETFGLLSIVTGWTPDLVIDLHADCDAPGTGIRDAEPASRAEVRIRRVEDLPASLDQWLDGLRPGRGIDSAPFAAGSASGYFALRRRPALRIDAGADDAAGLSEALFDVLRAAGADPQALRRAVAGADAALPNAATSPSTAAEAGYLVVPGWTVVEDTLRAHGVQGHRVVTATKASASRLQLRNVRFAARPTEGLVRLDAEVTAEPAVRVADAGSLWIPADQPLYELAAELLEPAAAESLTSWGLLSSLFAGENAGEFTAPVLRLHGPPARQHLQPWH